MTARPARGFIAVVPEECPVLVLGDAHAANPENRRALLAAYRAADAEVALQAGDLGYYDDLPTPTWFVAGNNEDFDVVEALRRGDAALGAVERPRLLDGRVATIEGVRVTGLSGTYAPTRYDEPREELSGERRRHFTREEVERTAALSDVEVLVTHQAPRGLLRIRGRDVGCDPIDELVSALEPALCLAGHFHRHEEADVGDTRVVSLAPAWSRYYRLDPETLELESRPTPEP